MKQVAVKRLGLFIMAVIVVAVIPAYADEWSKTYSLNGKPDLRVETSDADIHVTTWDQNTIEAKVITTRYKIGEGGIRVEEHQSGDSVEIDVRYPHHNFNVEWGSHRVDIIIQMPREGAVNLSTGDGKIELTGLKGTMVLHSGDGSVNLDGVGIDGPIRVDPRAPCLALAPALSVAQHFDETDFDDDARGSPGKRLLANELGVGCTLSRRLRVEGDEPVETVEEIRQVHRGAPKQRQFVRVSVISVTASDQMTLWFRKSD